MYISTRLCGTCTFVLISMNDKFCDAIIDRSLSTLHWQ